jgi:heme-binding NEAT domain protein
MKKLLIIIGFAFLSLNAQAQLDTVKNAILVKPVVVNALQKDTCYQLSWSVFGVNRNDTSGANSYVQLYDRVGKKVGEMNVAIPYSVLSKWLDDIVIDNFILIFLGLQKR